MKDENFRCSAFGLALCGCFIALAPAAFGETQHAYDSTTEVLISGTVEQVKRHNEQGRVVIHAVVSRGQEAFEVHLGPKHLLAWRQFPIAAGDRVEIVAAKVAGESHFLASSVKLGTRILMLRDTFGNPQLQ